MKLLQKAKEEEQNDIKEQQNSAKSGRPQQAGKVNVPTSVQSAVAKAKQRRKPK